MKRVKKRNPAPTKPTQTKRQAALYMKTKRKFKIPNRIWKLFNNHPERWVRGTCGKDAAGNTGYDGVEPQCVAWCLMGAENLIYGTDSTRVVTVLNNHGSAFHFNDTSDFTAILDFCKKHDL